MTTEFSLELDHYAAPNYSRSAYSVGEFQFAEAAQRCGVKLTGYLTQDSAEYAAARIVDEDANITVAVCAGGKVVERI